MILISWGLQISDFIDKIMAVVGDLEEERFFLPLPGD